MIRCILEHDPDYGDERNRDFHGHLRRENLANFSNLLAFDMIQSGGLPDRLGLLVYLAVVYV